MASRGHPQHANQSDPRAMNSLNRQGETSSSTWWCGAVSSETELLSAAVLCAAIAANSRANADANATDVTTAAERDASRRELEAFIRSSPLPHKLQLPVIEFTSKYIIVESAHSVICAVRATHTSDIVEAVLGSTVPLSQPYVYRYGGARIHLPFWKRAQQLELGALYSHARVRNKTLLLCGHSIAGSIAQLALCELVYQQLPLSARQALEKKDTEARKKDLHRNHQSNASSVTDGRQDTDDVWESLARDETLHATLPHVMVMGFGSPYISSHALQRFLNALQLTKRVVTLVNELDCIPGILNVAQSAAMLTKTTERFLTITKATKTLMKLLPAQMQSVFVGLGTSSHPAHVGNVTSAYISMSLHILQNTFHKFRELNVIKELDYQYAPCGTYLFLKKDSKEFKMLSEASAVLRELQEDDAATTALTGNSILQHLMSAYVDAIARRSTSIQINESMNHYERLGVSRQATPREIRSAYRSLALKWHPDRWSSAVNPREKDMAEQVFKLLAESYEVLSDAEDRAAYDAHLARGLSWTEEFVRQGTVRGMTLDEAIATFRDVLDGATGAVSRVTSRFTSSSSSVVGQSRIQRVDPLLATAKTNNGLVANNHNNLFAPDRIRVARRVGVGAEQQERIIFVQPDEILPGDIAAPAMANQNGRPGVPGMRTVSVLGGAVVVGASVALAVTAWNQYSESAKRDMQATAVRKMPGEYLLLLMDDHRTHHGVKPRKTTQVIEAGKSSSAAVGERTADAQQEETQTALVVRGQTGEEMVAAAGGGVAEQDVDEDDALVDEFFECLTEYEEARLESFAEDEFFDCVDLAEQVAMHFKPSIEPTSSASTTETPSLSDPTDGTSGDSVETIEFPVGSAVLTPFGLGTLEDWRPALTSAVVRFDASCVGFIQKKDISRGATRALTSALTTMKTKRTALSERVVVRLGLDKSQQPSTVRGLVQAGKDGAIDSGLRAAGGVVIAKGMARASTRLGGAVAAPLTIASILVDIGKDYYDYRQKQTERKNMGVLSTTSERLMMRDFRLKAGQHIASGTAAAAGASLGAYSVASAVGFWTGVGITGPIGVVAATGAAVVGGMLGFFAGSKAYDGYTAGYFTSYKTAKEQIDRLELGARILFNEYDPRGSGEISKTDCIQLISKLYEASGAVSESGYQGVLSVIQDDRFEGPVAWPVFWEWVSTEAARSLRKLEEDEAQKNHETVDVERESWWRSYVSYFSYANSALPPSSAPTFVAAADAALYPTVQVLFKFNGTRPAAQEQEQEQDSVAADTGRLHASELVILRAQIEYLVNAGTLTESDAFQLEQLLESEDDALRQSAQKTIAALHEGELDAVATNALAGGGGGIISDGFVGPCDGDGDVSRSTTRDSVVPSRRERTLSQDQIQMDVLCSLLSTDGLHQYLHSQHIEVTPETATRHDALHCLALQAATPPAAPSATV